MSTPAPDAVTTETVTVRRAPKIPVFMIFGGALGAIVTLIVTSLFPADPSVGFGATVGYFMLYGIPAGVVVGAVIGIILDRISRRRARSVQVERVVVESPDGP